MFVERTPSNGAIVSISLPSSTHEMPESISGGHYPILIVEDDEYSRLYAERIIKKLGFEVEYVASGKDALDKIHRQKYSTILLDIQLPDIDGITIAQSTREKCCVNSTTRIIAVTAHATPEDRRSYEQSGINQFLAKPFKIETLAQLLQGSLE